MKLPKRIHPDNLIDTIVGIGMNPLCEQDLWPGMISASLHKIGYEYEKKILDKPEINSPLCFFTKEHIRLMIIGNILSFNCERGHYVGWDVYSKEIKEVLDVVQQCGVTIDFNSVAILYLSRYENVDITDVVKDDFCVKNTKMPFVCQAISYKNEIENMETLVSLTNKTQRENEANSKESTSDFLVHVQEKFKDNDSIEFVCDLLNKIHFEEKKTFFGLLKEEFLQTLRPEY